MSTTDLASLALTVTDDLPIRHQGNVHHGKVRSVYWLTPDDSARLISERNYPVDAQTELGVMVTSDRISAFDVVWHSADGLEGVPGKGAALNAISLYWFNKLQEDFGRYHVLESPHPLAWIVQKAKPILVEFVARQYITGSMWRAYEEGKRDFCGIALPDGLKKDQKLKELLLTPTTKGTLRGLGEIPEEEDAKISRELIFNYRKQLGFRCLNDVLVAERLLKKSFRHMAERLEQKGYLLFDTKIEFGYVQRQESHEHQLILIDEAGTPDSSRIVDRVPYETKGEIYERSKEPFRQFLLNVYGRDILLNDEQMPERKKLAQETAVPVDVFREVSETYQGIEEAITGKRTSAIVNPREEIVKVLKGYNLAI